VLKLKRFWVTFIVTAGGAGFAPRAPGTAGTVVALVVMSMIRDWSPTSVLLLGLGVFFVGWWATLEWSRGVGEPDSQKVVIDEVLGYWLAMGTLPRENSILFIQFVLFRILDSLKPPPIRQFDRWGKRFPIGPIQSFGVIFDDLLAGALSWVITAVLIKYFPLT
jgi:phosphatidylglycerophosphatase A